MEQGDQTSKTVKQILKAIKGRWRVDESIQSIQIINQEKISKRI